MPIIRETCSRCDQDCISRSIGKPSTRVSQQNRTPIARTSVTSMQRQRPTPSPRPRELPLIPQSHLARGKPVVIRSHIPLHISRRARRCRMQEARLPDQQYTRLCYPNIAQRCRLRCRKRYPSSELLDTGANAVAALKCTNIAHGPKSPFL